MNNSNLFKLAHSLTKAVIKSGDSYQVTFGASIKLIKSVHSINGTEKQLAWANDIIAVAAYAIAKSVSEIDEQINCFIGATAEQIEIARKAKRKVVGAAILNFIKADFKALINIQKTQNNSGINHVLHTKLVAKFRALLIAHTTQK